MRTRAQFGLSCFRAEPDGSFSASTFNFYVFPEPVEGVQVRGSSSF
jgi:hypothetical protein